MKYVFLVLAVFSISVKADDTFKGLVDAGVVPYGTDFVGYLKETIYKSLSPADAKTDYSMAAGVLTDCRNKLERTTIPGAPDIAQKLDAQLNAMKYADHNLISEDSKKLTPQMAYVAAILICKTPDVPPKTRTFMLDSAYDALLRMKWEDRLATAVAAAHLLKQRSFK